MVCPPLGSAALGQDGSEGRLETNPVYQKLVYNKKFKLARVARAPALCPHSAVLHEGLLCVPFRIRHVGLVEPLRQ